MQSKRYVLEVDSTATGAADTNSGSSATIKDSDGGVRTFTITAAATAADGCNVQKDDASVWAGTPTTLDTIRLTPNAGAASFGHIRAISADGITLQLNEALTAHAAIAGDTFTLGGRFLTVGGAATLVMPHPSSGVSNGVIQNQLSVLSRTKGGGAGAWTLTIVTNTPHGMTSGDNCIVSGITTATAFNREYHGTSGGSGFVNVTDGTTVVCTLTQAADPGVVGGTAKLQPYVAGADDHVYIKANSGYSHSTNIVNAAHCTPTRQLVFEGYTTTPGDGGRVTLDYTGATVYTTNTGVWTSNSKRGCRLRNIKQTNSGNANGQWMNYAAGVVDLLRENCWIFDAATQPAFGFQGGSCFRCLSNSTHGGHVLAPNGVQGNFYGFNVAHDMDSTGGSGSGCTAMFKPTGAVLFHIADTLTDPVSHGGAFSCLLTSITGSWFQFCTQYNNADASGAGVVISDATGDGVGRMLGFYGCIVANNAGYGLLDKHSSVQWPFEILNDFYSNSLGDRFHRPAGTASTDQAFTDAGSDAYDSNTVAGYAAPSDKTVDPQFTGGSDLSVGANLKAAATIGLPFATGNLTTTYLDMGAAQRQETGGGLLRSNMSGGVL